VPDRRLALGAAGEQAAVEWYEAAGYQVVGRNWRCRDGELDVIAVRGRVAVFCEVKTRLGAGFGTPGELIRAGYSVGTSRSFLASSSTLTSLNVTTLTFFTNRAGRYMSHTHASDIVTSK